jgi:predicted ATPase
MSGSYTFGPEQIFELQCTNRKLMRGGVPVPLGARAFDVLMTLVEAGGELVTKEQLLQRAWPGLVVEEANVYVTIAQLRKVLGAEAIATVGGLGYRLAVPVARTETETPRHNLPAERTEFVGRQAVISEAQRRLERTRLLTLIGIGGTGKTRLALKVAEFALADHRNGVRWVDLAPLTDADHVGPALALTLGCKPHGSTSALAAVAAYCRELEMLLVLDNCEHLLDGVRQAADALLGAAPGLRILATSREALGLAGEVVLPIRPLELPAAGADADAIARSESVRLFMDRARAVAPAVAMSDDLAPVVAEICRRLDGLPLAIELAAARMRLLSAPQLLGLLGERFSLLTGSAGTLPRQQTLQAMIQWSYETAGVEAQRAMRAMSVCGGGCELDAVAALLGGATSANVMDCLARLLDMGLLRVDHLSRSTRYSMLDTVCQYALERLGESGEAIAVRDRHLNHFLRVVEELALQDARRFPDKWTERLDLERENILRAIAWCDTPGSAVSGLRFVVALRGYWPARGLLRVGRNVAVEALARPGAQTRDALRADALTALTQLCWLLGEFTEALGHGEEAMAIAENLGDAGLMGWASMALSYVHGALGDLAAAGHHAQAALRFARSAANAVLEGDALVAVADFHFESGDLALARERYEQAMAARSRLDLPAREGLVAISLAEVAIAQGQPSAARDWLRKAAVLAVRTRSRYIGHHVIEQCAALAAAGEEWSLSMRWFSASAQQRQATGLSEQTMSHTQRLATLGRALSAMSFAAAGEAERSGVALSYEQALEEVGVWLA